MIATDATSVVVVSHHRHTELRRCLRALICQGPARIVVVADRDARAVVDRLTGCPPIRFIACEDRNISVARNLGIEATNSDLIAFVDDDAIPTQGWLSALIAPFSVDRVVASTGFVRTRDTMRWQFRGEWIDRRARIHPLAHGGQGLIVLPPPENGAIVTIGTNCAFRRDAVLAVGGFDPLFRYFLDESDLNMRMAASGGLTAVVPDAEVRHYPAAGLYRTGQGHLHDLTEVGASLRIFQARHTPHAEQADAWAEAAHGQIHSLVRAMVRGDIEPRDVQKGRFQLRDGAILGFSRWKSAK